jgi:hypothetical protein
MEALTIGVKDGVRRSPDIPPGPGVGPPAGVTPCPADAAATGVILRGGLKPPRLRAAGVVVGRRPGIAPPPNPGVLSGAGCNARRWGGTLRVAPPEAMAELGPAGICLNEPPLPLVAAADQLPQPLPLPRPLAPLPLPLPLAPLPLAPLPLAPLPTVSAPRWRFAGPGESCPGGADRRIPELTARASVSPVARGASTLAAYAAVGSSPSSDFCALCSSDDDTSNNLPTPV